MRIGSVGATGEGVEDRLFAARMQLQHHSAAGSAARAEVTAEGSGAVEVACKVSDHAGERLPAVCTSGKTVEHALLALSVQLENDPAPDGATGERIRRAGAIVYVTAISRHAVEVAFVIPDQPRVRIRTPISSIKGVQHGELTGPIQLVNRSAAD